MGEDEGFEQRIAGQTVRAMQAGASHFAHGEQSAQGGLAMLVGFHAAALVVGGGNDRDRLLGDIDTDRGAGLVDFREPLLEELPRLMGDVEIDAFGTGAFHFCVDGAGHDVARGEVFERVVAFHELPPLFVDENPALAAHRLADEKRFGLRVEQAGRVKLHEFHVADRGAGAPGHGHAVPRSDVGIRRVEVDFAAAAGGQHDAVAS